MGDKTNKQKIIIAPIKQKTTVQKSTNKNLNNEIKKIIVPSVIVCIKDNTKSNNRTTYKKSFSAEKIKIHKNKNYPAEPYSKNIFELSINNIDYNINNTMIDYVLKQRLSELLKQDKEFVLNSNISNKKPAKISTIKTIELIKQDVKESAELLKKSIINNRLFSYSSKKVKVAITFGISVTGVAAVANIPTSVIVSQERIAENLNIQLNVLTEKNSNQSYMQIAHLEKQDTLSSLFQKLGIDDIQAENFVKNNPLAKFLLETRPEYKITAQINENKELLSLKAIIHSTASNAIWLNISRDENGKLTANKSIIPHSKEIEVSSGTINNLNFFNALQNEGIDDDIIKKTVDIFSSTINFHYDFKKGDKFRLVYERNINENEVVGYGRIIAAEIVNSKGTHQAIWYPEQEQYYTFDADALKRSFIKSPLEVSHVTSSFGMRHHPVHGYSRQHTGIDLAAPIGTSVYASADGVVDFVGTQSGYGKIVIIKHDKNISTYYAHLSEFNGIKPGDSVKQGDKIADSGESGVTKGPHLHYEYRIHNIPQNPLLVLGEEFRPLNVQEKQKFFKYTSNVMTQIQALREFDINNRI